jgi:hypothetical protein
MDGGAFVHEKEVKTVECATNVEESTRITQKYP